MAATTGVFFVDRISASEAIGDLKTVSAAADPQKLVLAMGFAVLFGLVHALMPGHGKSVTIVHGRLA